MAVSKLHTLYSVIHDSTAIPAISSLNIDPADVVRAEATAGELWPRFAALVAQNPITSFDTMALGTALGLVNLSGSKIADLTNKVALYAQKIAEGAARAGATSHRKMTINEGLIVPQRLSVSYQGDAVLTYQIVISYDGSNNALAISEDQSLPSAPTDNERFTIGPVQVANVVLNQVHGIDIDFNYQLYVEGADSDIWPTFVAIQTVAPKITFRGSNIEWWKDTGGIILEGSAATHANTVFYLRKRTAVGFVIDGTAEHIKFTGAGLAHHTQLFSASGAGASEQALVLETIYDGTNSPLTINAASAIT